MVFGFGQASGVNQIREVRSGGRYVGIRRERTDGGHRQQNQQQPAKVFSP
jgi:hypothetical protein